MALADLSQSAWADPPAKKAPLASRADAFTAYGRTARITVPATGAPMTGPGAASFQERLCAARVVALGEPGHGAHEPLALRNRVFPMLVARCGTRAIVLETGFTEARVLDNFVAYGKGTLDQALATGFTWGFGAFTENRALLEWMRSYSAAHPDAPLHIYGMDMAGGDPDDGMSHTRRTLDALLGFAAAHPETLSPSDARTLRAAADRFSLDGWNTAPKPLQSALRHALARMAKALAAAPSAPSANARRERAWARQNLRTALGSARMFAAWPRTLPKEGLPPDAWRSADARDAVMADNVLWAARQSEGPILVYAHNAHVLNCALRGSIWDAYARPATPMGKILHARLRAKMVTILASFGAVDPAATLAKGTPGSIDTALAAMGSGPFWLPLPDTKSHPASARWLRTRQTLNANFNLALRLEPDAATDGFVFFPRLTNAHSAQRP